MGSDLRPGLELKRQLLEMIGCEVSFSYASDSRATVHHALLQAFHPYECVVGVTMVDQPKARRCKEIPLNSLSYLRCKYDRMHKFKTDREYHDIEEEDKVLEEWQSDPEIELPSIYPDEKKRWSVEDMFAINQKLGVTSTFNGIETYSTAVPTGDEEARRRAEAIAREIERNDESKRNALLENDDEERDLDKETDLTAFEDPPESRDRLPASPPITENSWRKEASPKEMPRVVPLKKSAEKPKPVPKNERINEAGKENASHGQKIDRTSPHKVLGSEENLKNEPKWSKDNIKDDRTDDEISDAGPQKGEISSTRTSLSSENGPKSDKRPDIPRYEPPMLRNPREMASKQPEGPKWIKKEGNRTPEAVQTTVHNNVQHQQHQAGQHDPHQQGQNKGRVFRSQPKPDLNRSRGDPKTPKPLDKKERQPLDKSKKMDQPRPKAVQPVQVTREVEIRGQVDRSPTVPQGKWAQGVPASVKLAQSAASQSPTPKETSPAESVDVHHARENTESPQKTRKDGNTSKPKNEKTKEKKEAKEKVLESGLNSEDSKNTRTEDKQAQTSRSPSEESQTSQEKKFRFNVTAAEFRPTGERSNSKGPHKNRPQQQPAAPQEFYGQEFQQPMMIGYAPVQQIPGPGFQYVPSNYQQQTVIPLNSINAPQYVLQPQMFPQPGYAQAVPQGGVVYAQPQMVPQPHMNRAYQPVFIPHGAQQIPMQYPISSQAPQFYPGQPFYAPPAQNFNQEQQ